MIVSLFLLAATPISALDTERAYSKAIQTKGRRSAARAFGRSLEAIPACNAQATASLDPWSSVEFVAQTCEELRASANLDSRAERRPELIFISCEVGGPTVIVGSLVDAGKRVGSFKTVWNRSAEEWKWSTDHYSMGFATPAPETKLRILAPVCEQRPTFNERVALLKPDMDLMLSNLSAAQTGRRVDWLAAERRNVATDVIFTTGNGRLARGLPRKLRQYVVVGGFSVGASADSTLDWSGSLLDGARGAHSFVVRQWRGVKNGWQVVYCELNGVRVQ